LDKVARLDNATTKKHRLQWKKERERERERELAALVVVHHCALCGAVAAAAAARTMKERKISGCSFGGNDDGA